MKNNYKSTILLVVLLLVALVGAVMLSQQNQETRRGAYFAAAKIFLMPDQQINKAVGEDVPVHVWVDSGTAKVDNVQVFMCADNFIGIDDAEMEGARVTANSESGFNSVARSLKTTVGAGTNQTCYDVTFSSDKSADKLKSGSFEVGLLNFKAISEGTGQISVFKGQSRMSGDNPAGDDKAVSISEGLGTTFKINGSGGAEPSVTPSDADSYLNFKMSFAGVTAASQCANWKVQVMALGPNNVKKTYNDVSLTREGSGTGLQVFRGRVRLTGFAPTSGVAVFIKGPKSLQVKYGVNGQSAFYNKQGGELSGLTNNPDSSPTFDFTNYPLLAGDVSGDNAGHQDGQVDGRDFSYIKTEVAKNSSVTNGGNLPADLNGNCAYEIQDVALFMLSLKEKQEQLY